MSCCPHLAQAARCRHGPQRASRRPSSAFTIVAPVATARNNTDTRIPFDPRDTRIIANRPATVVNEVRVLTRAIMIWSSLRYFCPLCLTMTHERPLACVWSLAIHNALGNASIVCRCRSRGHWRWLKGRGDPFVARMSEARCGTAGSVWLSRRISLRSSGGRPVTPSTALRNTSHLVIPREGGESGTPRLAAPAPVSGILGHLPEPVIGRPSAADPVAGDNGTE
jgi:hypothetical protein